uniref:Uncharacterized protein n=1 Tax=Anguilla anguilla TaxID=7936 RepID=A0A0E9TY84_ANGAN
MVISTLPLFSRSYTNHSMCAKELNKSPTL